MKPYEIELGSNEATIRMLLPMRLQPTVEAHGWTDCHPFAYDEAQRTIYRIEREFLTYITEQAVEDGNRAVLKVRSSPSSTIERAVKVWIDVLNLDWELGEFYELCREDAILKQAEHIGAGRIMRGGSLFEDVCKAISFTNTRWRQAARTINEFISMANKSDGSSCTQTPSGCIYPFPSPEAIYKLGEDGLKRASLGYRARYLHKFVDRTIQGSTLRPEFGELTKIPGIGPTTARYLLIMYGRFDRVSADSAVVAHFRKVHPHTKPTDRNIQQYYESKFGRFAGLAWFVESLMIRKNTP